MLTAEAEALPLTVLPQKKKKKLAVLPMLVPICLMRSAAQPPLILMAINMIFLFWACSCDRLFIYEAAYIWERSANYAAASRYVDM